MSPLLTLRSRFRVLRRLALFGSAIFFTVAACLLMLDVFKSDGLTGFELTIVILFTINFLWIALSFSTSIAGLFLRALDLDPISLKRYRDLPLVEKLNSKTVVVVPVYNENPHNVFARIRSVYESLKSLGHESAFDFFILSDTRDPDIWIQEELGWGEMRRTLKGAKIFYRRREKNLEKKSGNLMEFCENWGGSYDFMIVFDADSVMSGAAMVRMVELMEANDNVGLIQSPPQPAGQVTLFARILQFISSVHGPTMTAGLAFWQLGSGNYWGHNAILRMQAFIECCGLPVLPGKPPLGGPIMSHDFVEAALLRRAGWKVWMVPALTGSWEELPPTVPDYAARDRRWCQGNLQHIRVVFGTKLRLLSRLHLFMGVMAYVSSPLWFALLFTSTLTAWEEAQRQHSFFTGAPALFPSWPIDRAGDMLTLLTFTLGMLIVPKFLSVFLLMARARTARLYGGRLRLLLSALGELVFSALLAPVMMLLHSLFVVTALLGKSVGWEVQNRDASGLSWRQSLRAHYKHVLIGLVWGTLAYVLNPGFFWWMTPVIAGLVLSPFLTHWSSLADFGKRVKNLGLFLTPEEVDTPKELARAATLSALPEPDRSQGLLKILTDPQASALHAALIPEVAPSERIAIEVGLLYEKLFRLGPETLSQKEKILLLSYPVKPLDQVLGRHGAPHSSS
ncbi:MAG: glucans biosynthesis glucosyltransferase MdoH [Pseudomonadota bacterium]